MSRLVRINVTQSIFAYTLPHYNDADDGVTKYVDSVSYNFLNKYFQR